MNYATIATFAVFFIYTGLSWAIIGPLDSISKSYYLWKKRNYSAAFNWFGLAALLSCIAQTQYDHENLTYVFFVLAAACMWGLTVASEYVNYPMYHYIPTIMAIVFGYAAVWAEFGFGSTFYWSLGLGVAGAILLHFVPRRTTFQELWFLNCILTPFIR